MALHLGLHLYLLGIGLACLIFALAPTAFVSAAPVTGRARRPRMRRETVKIAAAFYTSGALHLFNNKSEVLILREGQKPTKGNPYTLFQLPKGYKLNAALAVPTFFTKDLYFFGDGDTFYRRNNRVLTSKLYKNRLPRFLQCGIDATVKDENYVYYFRGCSYLQQVNDGEWIKEPQPVGDLGLPCNVDAAWNDGANSYVLKGDQVWTVGGDVKDHEPFDEFYFQNVWRLDRTPVALFNESERFPSAITRRSDAGNALVPQTMTKRTRRRDACRLPRKGRNRKERRESKEEQDGEEDMRGGTRGSRRREPSIQEKREGEVAVKQMMHVDFGLPVGGDMKKIRNSKSESYDRNDIIEVGQVEEPPHENATGVTEEDATMEDFEVNATALADPFVAPLTVELELPIMREEEQATEMAETELAMNASQAVDKEEGVPTKDEEHISENWEFVPNRDSETNATLDKTKWWQADIGLPLSGMEAAISETVSGETVAGEKVMGETATSETVSGETVTGERAMGETVTDETISGETVTGETVSGETVTGETVSDETVTGEKVPGEMALGKTDSGETVTDETVSGETVSGETVAGEIVPGKTIIGETVSDVMVSGEIVTGEMVTGETVMGEMTTGDAVDAGAVGGNEDHVDSKV